jgi:pyrroloquinoline quinone (PQQ) biosynthesis protein C
MQENDKDGDGTHELHQYHKHLQKGHAQSAAIGYFVDDCLLRHHLPYVYAGEESPCRNQDIRREKIKEIE